MGITWNISVHLVVGLVVRVCCLLYGIWQDSTMVVKYTDVDYYVFTDAARFVLQGESPYRRATYRYTPVLAWILTPNISLSESWGKVLFILCDILVGYLIYRLVKLRSPEKWAVGCALLWIYNPLPITVSSRGNAESVLAALILLMFYLLTCQAPAMLGLGFLLYGFTVHMKIYPIVYSLPLYLALGSSTNITRRCWLPYKWDIWPNKRRMALVLLSVIAFLLFTGMCYLRYGEEFIQETYTYHLTRRDTRHNFSVYFYLLYLTSEMSYSLLLGLLAFLPQAVLLLVTSLFYNQDLPFCCFINTFIFVTFNKVCTSQYFLWYLCLLPLIIPHLRMSLTQAVTMLLAWFAGQALWLCPAYYLEFEGQNTFFFIWLAGMLFFTINIGILCLIINAYSPSTFLINKVTPTADSSKSIPSRRLQKHPKQQ